MSFGKNVALEGKWLKFDSEDNGIYLAPVYKRGELSDEGSFIAVIDALSCKC